MSILNRALMKYHNEFFTMSKEEQDVWKLTDHEDELDDNIRAFVATEMGYPHPDGNYTDEQILKFNEAMQPFVGIGPNDFSLNEFDWDGNILKFKNIYEYNEYYYHFQKEANERDFPDSKYKIPPLYNMSAFWARAMIDGKFSYLLPTSLQFWISYHIQDLSMDWIKKQIPHEYVEGKNHGERSGGGSRWDMVIDANGLEGWYEQIRDYSYQLQHDIISISDFENKIYIMDTSRDENDPTLTYVFGSMDVLKDITFKDFINDCEKVKGDPKDVIAVRDAAGVNFIKKMEVELERIKATSSPNVVELKQKNKMIIADGALDDL